MLGCGVILTVLLKPLLISVEVVGARGFLKSSRSLRAKSPVVTVEASSFILRSLAGAFGGAAAGARAGAFAGTALVGGVFGGSFFIWPDRVTFFGGGVVGLVAIYQNPSEAFSVLSFGKNIVTPDAKSNGGAVNVLGLR